MANLLITGGAGFIGSHFTDYWLLNHAGDRVVVLDALTYAGNPRNLAAHAAHPRFRFVHADILDQPLVESLLHEEHIDTLVHFAAESHVDRSIADADAFIATNIVGTHSLLKAARRVWLGGARSTPHRFHHVSTDEVYGSLAADDPPVDEGSAYAPNSPYAASKAAADHLVRAYGRTHGLPVTTSNCSNNYGPRQLPEKLIPRAIVNLLRGQAVPLYGDGGNLRDWLHVQDHCRGIGLVLQKGVAGEVYGLGGGETAANRDLVRLLCGLMDQQFARDPDLARQYPDAPPARGAPCESLLQNVADRPGHDWRYAMSGEKAKHRLGFTASVSLNQGLAETIAWYLGNPDWWRGHR